VAEGPIHHRFNIARTPEDFSDVLESAFPGVQ
jgi:hypothetical protein